MVPNTPVMRLGCFAGQSCGVKAGIKKENETGFFHTKSVYKTATGH